MRIYIYSYENLKEFKTLSNSTKLIYSNTYIVYAHTDTGVHMKKGGGGGIKSTVTYHSQHRNARTVNTVFVLP